MRFEPFDNIAHFLEDVGLFESAMHPAHVEVTVPKWHRLCVAVDQTEVGESARWFAETLSDNHQASVEVIKGLERAGDILQRAQQAAADLLIVPIPFGRQSSPLGHESLGAIGDMLIAEARLPLLCLRQPMSKAEIARSLSHILVPLAFQDHGATVAAGWAFALVAPGGHLEFKAVADMSVVEHARHYLRLGEGDKGQIDSDVILQTFMQDMAGLTSAVQHLGRERHVHVAVSMHTGDFVKLVMERANSQPTLVIWGSDHRSGSAQYHRGVDLVLSASGPVLLV